MSNEKLTDYLAGAVISSQVTLNFYERLKGTPFFRHRLKNALNLSIKELIKAERDEYDKLFDAKDDETSNITNNLSDVVDLLCKDGLSGFIVIGNIYRAWKKDPKSIEGITKKILRDE